MRTKFLLRMKIGDGTLKYLFQNESEKEQKLILLYLNINEELVLKKMYICFPLCTFL